MFQIFFFQILYLNGRNLRQKYKTRSLLQFSKTNFSFIRPSKRSIFNVNDPEGVKYLTILRLRFSHLDEHKFRHRFLDTLNPSCNSSLDVENNEHFSLRCLNSQNARRSLFIDISSINSSFKNLPSNLKVELLLFGDSKLSAINNNLILKASIKYTITLFSFFGLEYVKNIFPPVSHPPPDFLTCSI